MDNSLSNHLHKYIYHKGDIGMEANKQDIINHIIRIYKELWGKDEYLGWLHNDILLLVGFKINLQDMNDHKGVLLWDDIDKNVGGKNSTISKITEFLYTLPLYSLYSLIGYNTQNLQIKPDLGFNPNP